MKSKKNIVIFDIDGTLSKVGDRLKYLKQTPKNWDLFYKSCFNDEPIEEVCSIANLFYRKGYRLFFCTGRRESVRDQTRIWLCKHVFGGTICPGTKTLLMRGESDLRHDTEVKPELLRNAGIDFKDISIILEDRNSMVAKWRELGLTCFQVAEGDF